MIRQHSFNGCDGDIVMEYDKLLVEGMGYKSCWMVIEGSTQQKIADILLQKKIEYDTYQAGLDKLNQADFKENIVFVTADYQNTNFVMGISLSRFFDEQDQMIPLLKPFSRVYLYLTHRVCECHGFAVLEYGVIKRFYYFNEDDITDIGEPLPAEVKLGFHLPKDFDEMWEQDDITEMDEEIIIALAAEQTGVDAEKYPYENIIIGEMM